MSDDRLDELGKQLPWDRPDDARREAVRSALLAAARHDHEARGPRYKLVGAAFVAGALAAAAATYVIVRPHAADGPRAVPVAAAIDAPPEAEYVREVVHDGSGHLGEVVRVHAGTLHVASAHAGEPVHVATADARVDGEGAYDLEVADDHLRALTVRTGSAKLALHDQQVIVLAAGQTWKAPVITAQIELPSVQPSPSPAPVPVPVPAPVAVPIPAPVRVSVPVAAPSAPAPAREPAPVTEPTPAPPPVAAAEPTPAPPPVAAAEPTPAPSLAEEPTGVPAKHTPSATEQHFAAGWALLKDGKAAEAARELGVAADSDGDPSLAADARYFQAVALARAGRKTEAETALVAFLDHAPKSLRRGRAAVMLAKLIAERGDRKSARAWFESALGDPDPAVVAAARAGLAAR